MLHLGVYAVTYCAITREARWMAEVLTGPGAVLSHRSAAALWAIRPSERRTRRRSAASRAPTSLDVLVARYPRRRGTPKIRRLLETPLDGGAAHHTRHAFERDRARDRKVVAGAHRVVRVTWRHLHDDPAALAAELRRLLSARR